MTVKTLGRCPDCGKPAPTIRIPGRATEILEHGCLARPCHVAGCLVARVPDDMVQFPGGAWYCPSHGLLTVLRELLILHRSGNCQDIMAVLFDETVPTVLDRFPR
jgi:hypothetical protein